MSSRDVPRRQRGQVLYFLVGGRPASEPIEGECPEKLAAMPSPLVAVDPLVRRSAAIIGQSIPAFPARCDKLLPASPYFASGRGLGIPP